MICLVWKVDSLCFVETLREVYFGSFCLPRLEIFGYSHFPGILGRLSHENQSHVECLVVRFAADKRHFLLGLWMLSQAELCRVGRALVGFAMLRISLKTQRWDWPDQICYFWSCAALCLIWCCLLVEGVLVVHCKCHCLLGTRDLRENWGVLYEPVGNGQPISQSVEYVNAS